MISSNFDLGRYQALIFDMDGTLLDSSRAIHAVFSRWCAKHQLDVEYVLALCHGSRLVDYLDQLLPHANAQQEIAEICADEALETSAIVALPGARDFLDKLNAAGIPWGIATSSVEAVARMRLTTAGLPIPEILVTGEQISKGKPDPEHFATAAARLGVKPEDCLAFEDSANGVQSALQAGCDVVVIGEYRPDTALNQPQLVAQLHDYQNLVNHINISRGNSQ